MNLNPFRLVLRVYGQDLISNFEGKHIAIDGKRIRSSKGKQGSTHILSAWVDDFSLSIAQETVQEKRKELQAISELLDSLELTGAVVSIDPMGTQTAIAKQIITAGGGIIFSVSKPIKGICLRMFKQVLLGRTNLIVTKP